MACPGQGQGGGAGGGTLRKGESGLGWWRELLKRELGEEMLPGNGE